MTHSKRWSPRVRSPFSAISYAVAIQEISSIVELENIALEDAAQIFPLVVGAFFWRRASRQGAVAGFTFGVVVTAVLKFGVASLPSAFPGFLAGFYGLIVNVVVFIALSLTVEAVSDENLDRVQGYVERAISRQRDWPASADD